MPLKALFYLHTPDPPPVSSPTPLSNPAGSIPAGVRRTSNQDERGGLPTSTPDRSVYTPVTGGQPKRSLGNLFQRRPQQVISMGNDQFSMQLSRAEALVPFDFLSRYSDSDRLEIVDQAEQRVLWNMCCALESGLTEILHPDYKTLLQSARDAVRGEE
jgi:hypothetical protein